MKFILVTILLQIVLFKTCSNQNASEERSFVQQKTEIEDTVLFISHIQPILVARCSPCHFHGGKMYEKLPFDKPETIINLNEALLKRIKDEKENFLIRSFITSSKK